MLSFFKILNFFILFHLLHLGITIVISIRLSLGFFYFDINQLASQLLYCFFTIVADYEILFCFLVLEDCASHPDLTIDLAIQIFKLITQYKW